MRNFASFTGAAVLIFCSWDAARAQTAINGGRAISGNWDASNAATSKPAKTGTLLPQTCGVGEQFFKTDAASGQNLYFCTAVNTWVQMTGGSGGGGGSAPSVLIYKGDLNGYSTTSTRVPVGADGTVLTADSTQPNGLSYRPLSASGTFASRPVCSVATMGETYYPSDGILGYRCDGSNWAAFGPITPVTPFRLGGTNSFGIVGTGATTLSVAALSSGSLTLASCQQFPTTVGMILVDSEIIAGTCSGTTLTPITGGRGYNQTTAASHSAGAAVTEQLFVWGKKNAGTSTQAQSSVSVSGGFVSFLNPAGGPSQPMLVKPAPNGPGASYTVTAGFILSGLSSGDQGCGVGFRQSSNDNEAFVLFHSITWTQAFYTIGEYQYTDNNYSGTYINLNASALATGIGVYFRLQDTLTNRNVFVSSDGLNFSLVHSVPENDFLSPDQVFLSCSAGTVPTLGNFYSWAEGR